MATNTGTKIISEKAAKALAECMGGTATYEITLGWVVTWTSEMGEIIVMDDTGIGHYLNEQDVKNGDPLGGIAFSE